jgi:hypothetical protein
VEKQEGRELKSLALRKWFCRACWKLLINLNVAFPLFDINEGV